MVAFGLRLLGRIVPLAAERFCAGFTGPNGGVVMVGGPVGLVGFGTNTKPGLNPHLFRPKFIAPAGEATARSGSICPSLVPLGAYSSAIARQLPVHATVNGNETVWPEA